MYWDLIIIGVLITAVIFFYKDFKSFIYLIGSIDILLRILNFIKENSNVKELNDLIKAYFPKSIPDIIGKYTDGTFYTIIMWLYVIVFAIFLGYIIRTIIKRK